MTVPLRLRADVAAALAAGGPVVALESTLVVHGLPRSINLTAAAEIEEIVRTAGAMPATIGVVGGKAVIGLTTAEIERLSTAPSTPKLGVRDLPVALARGLDGATTVASTAYLAHCAGVAVFATGGLGGVHRGAAQTFDESADLGTLARTPITVVSAGVKSILDVGATLERLESLGVTVLGWQTDRFPGFYLTDSGHALDWRVETEEEVAAVMYARDALGLRSAVLVANPIEIAAQLDPDLHDRILAEGAAAAAEAGVQGKAITPFLLDYFHRETGGESLRVNLHLVKANARLAARIAAACMHAYHLA